MAELKTKPGGRSVERFLRGVKDPEQRQDALALLSLMRGVTRIEPRLWGTSIVGFGTYRYKYDTGRSGEWFMTGFSPRKQSLTVYIMPGIERYGPLLAKLGKHRIGRSCLYINRLSDIDVKTLREIVRRSIADLKAGTVASTRVD